MLKKETYKIGNPKTLLPQDRSSRSQMFVEIGVLKNFVILTGTHLCWRLFFNGLQLHPNETPTQVFSCEICEIFKNICVYRTPRVAAPAKNVFTKIVNN